MRITPVFFMAVLLPLLSARAQHENISYKVDELILRSRFDDAMALVEQQLSGEPPSIVWQNKKAEILLRSGDIAQAGTLLNDLEARAALQNDRYLKGLVQANAGYYQLHMGRHDLAEVSLQGAMRLLEESGNQTGPAAAQTLSTLGLVYMAQGKYAQAQEQLHRALSLREDQAENREAFIAATLNDLGLAYSQTDKDAALGYYERAREQYLKLYGGADQRIAIANINIGIIYREMDLPADAVSSFETALAVAEKNFSGAHPSKAIALYNLGQTYLLLQDEQTAMSYYLEALAMYEDSYGPRHPEVSSVLNAMGNVLVAQGAYDSALSVYESALAANGQDPSEERTGMHTQLHRYYNGTQLLHTLLFKAQAYTERYTKKSLRFSDLKTALDLLMSSDTLISQLRQHTANESDKLLLGTLASEVYADAVRVAYLAGQNAFKKDFYFEKAFYFAEKSKAAVLLETISDANAKSYAGIPQSLLEEERDLKSKLAVNARRLAEGPGPEEEEVLRAENFTLKRKFDAFAERLEKQYPAYFSLKFSSAMPAVSEIQPLLNDHSALLSYFPDDKRNQLYIFVIRNHHFKVWQRPMGDSFDRYVTGLRNGIYFREIDTYQRSASTLGQILIPPLAPQVKDLIVLPAGRLGVVPFEALLSEYPAKTAGYESMDYLINRYSIRYEFSAGLLLQKNRTQRAAAAPNIFLCAPVQFPQRKYLGELPGTASEVEQISDLFASHRLGVAVVTRTQANEERIKAGDLSKFNLLHFATHGVVDEANPELSRIFLQSSALEDGDLYSGEIYNLHFDADLITLSACQTGIGKVVKGEGVIGLSRALVYAGARNIMVSFWNVADESTAVLMKGFYEKLLTDSKTGYAQSLRHAKLQLIKHEKFSAPFYWAPFVLIGY